MVSSHKDTDEAGGAVNPQPESHQNAAQRRAERRAHLQPKAAGKEVAAAAAPHTDHPPQHWDRTCPACLATSETREIAQMQRSLDKINDDCLRAEAKLATIKEDIVVAVRAREEAERQFAGAEADAQRYRWLRARPARLNETLSGVMGTNDMRDAELDARIDFAIDAALKEKP